MAGFLNIPEKMTEPVNFRHSLGGVFPASVDDGIRERFHNALVTLNGLRSAAVSGRAFVSILLLFSY